MGQLAGVLLAAFLALSVFTCYWLVASGIAAVVFGPRRAPRWVRPLVAASPRGPLEWFGFAVACVIALVLQIAAVVAFFGLLGMETIAFAPIWGAEMLAAVALTAWLIVRALRTGNSPEAKRR